MSDNQVQQLRAHEQEQQQKEQQQKEQTNVRVESPQQRGEALPPTHVPQLREFPAFAVQIEDMEPRELVRMSRFPNRM